MNKQDTLGMIAALSNARGLSGFEDEVVEAARRYGGPCAELREDSLRNLYLTRRENAGNRPVVLLDAHSDEVGFMVHHINPNGTLSFIAMGGWVAGNVPAHAVLVRNADGAYIPGIIASKPPHFMSEAERKQALDIPQMVIDVGATSAEEVRRDFRIRVGAPVVPDVVFSYREAHGLMMGKAFDCRLGCAALLGTLDALRGETLDVDVVGVLSSQEEVGARGAAVAANTVKPAAAIVFEGCPADDTFGDPAACQTAIKKGPYLRHIDARMITNPRFQRLALETGEELGVPVQEGVRTGGSTNGSVIHVSNAGVPCIVIGLPVRYIHSHYGIAAYADYESAVKLACGVLRRLSGSVIEGF
ncbi:MAG: M42 family metallopeptidase [Oscillospiraceae bacterium]